jgi:hypothetical protein
VGFDLAHAEALQCSENPAKQVPHMLEHIPRPMEGPMIEKVRRPPPGVIFCYIFDDWR